MTILPNDLHALYEVVETERGQDLREQPVALGSHDIMSFLRGVLESRNPGTIYSILPITLHCP